MATGLKRINYADIGIRLSNNNYSYNKSRKRHDIKKNRKASFNILETVILETSMEAEKFEHDKLEDKNNILNNNNNKETGTENIIQNGIEKTDEVNETKKDDNDELVLNRNDFISNTEYIKARRRRTKDFNKLYINKKHHSDYDVVYLHVDSHDDVNESRDRSASTETLGSAVNPPMRRHSHSDTNLQSSDPHLTSLPPTGRIKKASSHRDITSTQMYKDIYTDNLRQYGFLLAKQLGTTNKSPDQLRKSYLKSRQKALERREKKSSIVKENERRNSDLGLHKVHSDSNSSLTDVDHLKLTDGLAHSKYSDSLTDISNIGSEEDLQHVRKSQSCIRRKHKNVIPRDPSKRLSAPLLHLGISIDDIINDNLSPTKSSSMTSLNVPDLSYSSSGSENDVTEEKKSSGSERRNRKLSVESQRRQDEAKERQHWRKSRLTSFDGMLSQADKLMKDIKRKSSSSLSPISPIEENIKVIGAV